MKYHQPVMLKECIEGLSIKENGTYVDVTYGGGGHADGDWQAKKVVNHPGVEPRNFEKEIANDYKPTFRTKTETAMKKSAKLINQF